MPKVAVIGGGWSGLAAAVELVENRFQVSLFEAGKMLGGRARSTFLNGRELDNGQHILLGAYTHTLRLIRRIGITEETILRRFPLGLYGEDGFLLRLPRLPAPLNLAVGLLLATGVGFQEKLSAARWIQSLKKQRFVLNEDISVACWLDKAGQSGKLRHALWEPLCLAALNTPCEKASAQIFANVLRDSLGSSTRACTDILIPLVPLGNVFPEPARQWLQQRGAEISLSHRVRHLDMENKQVDGQAFDAVVVAVAPQHSLSFLPSLSQMTYEPIATIYLGYQKNSFTSKEGSLWCLQTTMGPIWIVQRMDSDVGERIFSGVISGSGAWEQKTNAELVEITHQAFLRQGSLHKDEANLLWSSVIREKRATFSCQPNLVRPAIKSAAPGIWRVGDYTWSDYPGTLEGAVRSGCYAAQEIIATFKRR